jgi:hypothetical protein
MSLFFLDLSRMGLDKQPIRMVCSKILEFFSWNLWCFFSTAIRQAFMRFFWLKFFFFRVVSRTNILSFRNFIIVLNGLKVFTTACKLLKANRE